MAWRSIVYPTNNNGKNINDADVIAQLNLSTPIEEQFMIISHPNLWFNNVEDTGTVLVNPLNTKMLANADGQLLVP